MDWDWGKCEFKDNSVTIPDNWLHIHYYEALTVFFRIENSLRVFVYAVLKNHHSSKWVDQSVEIGTEKKQLSELFSRRKSLTDDFGYIGEVTHSPLMFLTLGEISSLITGPNWEIFKNYFPAKRDVIKAKFDEINVIRNSFAHFRTVRKEDVDLVKIYAEQILTKVAVYLNDVTTVNQSLPTNTDSSWYGQLHKHHQPYTFLELKESSDSRWLKLYLRHFSGLIPTKASAQSYYSGEFLKLDIYELLNDPILKKHVTYISEESLSGYFAITDKDSVVQKYISLTFDKSIFQLNYETELKSKIFEFIKIINEESEKVKNDKLHRGKFVSSQSIFFSSDKKYWSCSDTILNSTAKVSNEPEFWESTFSSTNYMMWTSKFPWMKSDIAKDEFPF